MKYYDESGQTFIPNFSRVYSPYVDGNLVVESTLDSIPIDLSRDSTVLIFEYEDQIDTLAFCYERELNVGTKSSSYCIKLFNARVKESTTFEQAYIWFEYGSLFNDDTDNYTGEIFY